MLISLLFPFIIHIPVLLCTPAGWRASIILLPKVNDPWADDYGQKLRRRKQYGDFFDKEVSEIKRKVLTVINHEMRTPLTYVVAYADMLNRDAEDLTVEDMRSFLRGINVGANLGRSAGAGITTMVNPPRTNNQPNRATARG